VVTYRKFTPESATGRILRISQYLAKVMSKSIVFFIFRLTISIE